METTSLFRERIDPNSKEYRDEYNRENQLKNRRIFGATIIEKINEARLITSEIDRATKERSLMDWLKEKWKSVFEFHPYKAQLFFTEIVSSHSIREKLQQFFVANGRLAEVGDDKSPFEIFMSDPHICLELPDNIVEEATKNHIENEQRKFQKFESEELPGLMEKVNESIEEAIDQGVLPINLDQWHLLRANVVIVLQDFVLDERTNHGSFAPDTGIQISPELSFEEKFHTLLHEFLHALSGKKVNRVRKVTKHDFEEDLLWTDVDIYFDHQRHGLSFNRDYPFRRERFLWLDEAMTEQLAMDVGKLIESESYCTERELLNLLVQSLGEEGKKLFVNVYFENFNPKDESKKRHENLRRLMKAIDQKLGERFLVRLDMFIYEQRDGEGNLLHWMDGVEKATNLWQKHRDNFPQFLDNWINTREEKFQKVSRDIVEQFQEEKRDSLKGVKSYEFGEFFEKLWETDLLKRVAHPSKYEIAVIKESVKKLLFQIVGRGEKK